MSQVTDPVLLDSTGQNIVTGISAVVSAIQSRGMPSPSASNPQMDGTASPGTSNDYARGDHVHPENPANAKTAQLAYVESGTTASRTYAVGEYFCWNGLLYRAKTAISSGASFTPGTNCEQVTVGEDLLKLDNLIAKTPGSGTRDAQLQVGTYNSVATMSFVSLPSRSPGKPDVYVDFAETYIRVYYVKSDGTTTTKTYLPS